MNYRLVILDFIKIILCTFFSFLHSFRWIFSISKSSSIWYVFMVYWKQNWASCNSFIEHWNLYFMGICHLSHWSLWFSSLYLSTIPHQEFLFLFIMFQIVFCLVIDMFHQAGLSKLLIEFEPRDTSPCIFIYYLLIC